ncbi:hypothetical protein MAPG_00770 [Magnaporthiopsis poae ATCC 64411]|uniref:DNA-directed RNA polymerase III subunit RPC9 n=1 Tax=Magnaporthiopsis poae (strain ATCC 64411 / 73-15) TaxID=644358 RepID=A0A0C4DLX1_MAGP6|nr:hypothetical protein MAPG_00770 [Magnaporthiopsis poae ATCC 64411]
MKILESQNAVLSNYEVYTHLVESKARFIERQKKDHRRPPKNYQIVTKDVIQYCQTYPNPLSQQPSAYDQDSIATLVERLAEFGLSKGEVLMIINLRPTELPGLYVCVEEMAERYSADQQSRMLDIVVQVLGCFPRADGEYGGGEGEEPIADSIENGQGA